MGVYGDPIIIYPKPYSIYLRGTIQVWGFGCQTKLHHGQVFKSRAPACYSEKQVAGLGGEHAVAWVGPWDIEYFP